MKISFLLLLTITFISCNDHKTEVVETRSNVSEDSLHLKGVWELVGYYNYVDNKVTDSFKANAEIRQVKMYTDNKVMWSKNVPADSTEWFGYGNYQTDANQLTEMLEYGSEMMRKIIEERKEFKYELLLDKNKFSQIEIDDDGNRIYSENYKRIE